MIPTAKYSRCCGITVDNRQCRKTGGCSIHQSANDERRRRDDEAHMAKLVARPQQMSLPLSREQRDALIQAGRQQAIAESKGFGSAPCGCQG